MRIQAYLLIMLLLLSPTCTADDATQVDEQLLEDLGSELLQPPQQPLDEKLLDQLGEDLGQPQDNQDTWIHHVVENMQTAQELLQQGEETSQAVSAQDQALTGLDAMIAELSRRKSQCSGSKASKSSKPGNKPSKGKAGKSPAKAGSPETTPNPDFSTEQAIAGELLKDLWGELPERQRDQILQPLSEEFLPKYAAEIEAYFRAMARPKSDAESDSP